MPWRVSDDELSPVGREIPVRNVDGDSLLALGSEPVEQERQVQLVALCADPPRVRVERGQLVLEDETGLIQQPPNQRALAVVDAAACDEAEQLLVLVRLEIRAVVGNSQRLQGSQK